MTYLFGSVNKLTQESQTSDLPINGIHPQSPSIHTEISPFDVLRTVHLSIILVINQLSAQKLVLQQVCYMPLHVSSTMCSSSGGQNCIIQHLVSSHL